MNVLLALGLFSWLAYSRGEEIILSRTVGSVASNSFAETLGFRTGDEIEAVNGTAVKSWNDFMNKMLLAALQKDAEIRLHRTGGDSVITLPYGALSARSDSLIQNFGVYPAGLFPSSST